MKRISLVLALLAGVGIGVGLAQVEMPEAAAQGEGITDAQAIRFVNEQVRPLSERVRALKAEIDALEVDWFQKGINTTIGTGTLVIEDGRDAEGVSRLTQSDVTDCVANLFAVRNAVVDSVIAKPCVRPLEAQ